MNFGNLLFKRQKLWSISKGDGETAWKSTLATNFQMNLSLKLDILYLVWSRRGNEKLKIKKNNCVYKIFILEKYALDTLS